jgi:transketolase
MRTAFITELVELARVKKDIFLVVGDLGFSVVEPFAREFPDRFLNAGVAEQNMTGLAAGLASEGYHVFTYSIANFPTFRCAEQIRNDIAYHKLPVTVVAVGGGVAYGSLGYSHHAVQDMALLRLFPNMLLGAPGDPEETRAILRYLVNNPQPSYLRLGKAGEPLVHKSGIDVLPGQLIYLAKKTDSKHLLLTTAASLKLASDVFFSSASDSWELASLPLWGEFYKEKIAMQLQNYREVICVEDHLVCGGFGSFLQEVAASFNLRCAVKMVALSASVCDMVANQIELNKRGGVNQQAIQSLLARFQ